MPSFLIENKRYSYRKAKKGEGGFFEVYEGYLNSNKNIKLAVKFLKGHRKKYAQGAERGYEKQRLLNTSKLFPHLYDIGYIKVNNEEKLVIIEEWLEGDSLEEKLEEVYKKDFPSKIKMMKDIAYGVFLIHSMDFVHRDLHAGNIQIPNKKNTNVKVMDFSAAIGTAENVVGKFSPGERIRGRNRDPSINDSRMFDKKSDIYSLGIIFSEILLGTSAENIGPIPSRGNNVLVENILERLNADRNIEVFMKLLIKGMLSKEGLSRPNISDVLLSLERNEYIQVKFAGNRKFTREKGFAFMKKSGARLEIFMRTRDVNKLSLLPRSQLDLSIFLSAPEEIQEEKNKSKSKSKIQNNRTKPDVMLLTPARFIKSSKVLLYANVTIPNYYGVLNHFQNHLALNYNVLDIKKIEGFLSTPNTNVFLILGIDKHVSNELNYYLNPLHQYIRAYLFNDLREYLRSINGGIEIWEEWLIHNSPENSLSVSASLYNHFNGKIVPSRSARGYLSSANHQDNTHQMYSVIKGIDIGERIPEINSILDKRGFIMLKTVTDSKQRDVVFKFCKNDIHLARVQVRSLLPTNFQPDFLDNIIEALDKTIGVNNSSGLIWNIESFEFRHAVIKWQAGDKFSVRLSVYISCSQRELDPVLKKRSYSLKYLYEQIEHSLEETLQKMNGESNEIYVTNIFQNNHVELRYIH